MDKLGPKTESPNYWWLKLANEKDEKEKEKEKEKVEEREKENEKDEKEKDEEREKDEENEKDEKVYKNFSSCNPAIKKQGQQVVIPLAIDLIGRSDIN